MEIHVTRKLRKTLTPWERKLWNLVRNRKLKNAKFRRQFSIPPYSVDFICLDARLIIELDGGHHNNPEEKIKDEQRQKFLENKGYKVLRFWNNEIENNLEGVVLVILQHL